jgi:hypothetical protein
VESVTWAPGGTLDYWVKERREWWAAYGVQNGHQKWVKAANHGATKEG